MRIAFITPEFVTELGDGGGLGNYLFRLSRLLVEAGHEPEIFVSSERTPTVFQHEGIRVERVAAPANLVNKAASLIGLGYPLALRARAGALAKALSNRDRVAPFDLVQSADYLGVGNKIESRAGRPHLVRCSSAADLYHAADGRINREARWCESYQRQSIQHADKAYAPSALVADHYNKKHGLAVGVVRPPLSLEVTPADEPPCGLPPRFLLHFGQLNARKGTFWLAQALQHAFALDPTLRMVWIGRGKFERISAALANLGPHCGKVLVLYPMPKRQLYAVVQRAEAAVLPSLVDNLPNTVIESLMLGIPVIGTRGASIDELVEEGVNGELANPSDIPGLAEAMVRVWQGRSPARKGFVWDENIAQEMQPGRALASLFKFAGVTPAATPVGIKRFAESVA